MKIAVIGYMTVVNSVTAYNKCAKSMNNTISCRNKLLFLNLTYVTLKFHLSFISLQYAGKEHK